jgi:hypothetical protein
MEIKENHPQRITPPDAISFNQHTVKIQTFYGCLEEKEFQKISFFSQSLRVSKCKKLICKEYMLMNDLWKYNLTSNEWTWVSGSMYGDQYGYFESKGEPHEDNVPGARHGGCLWEDSNGAVWLFGGYGYSVYTGSPIEKGIFFEILN